MLSIQVHPSKEDAQIAFDAENKLGIDPASPESNFKDNNHKPELMLALSEFWLFMDSNHRKLYKRFFVKHLNCISWFRFLGAIIIKSFTNM